MDNVNKLIYSKKIVILYFYSDECIKTNKLVDKIQKCIIGKNILLDKYDVNKYSTKKIIKEFNINCYPTFLIYKDGIFLDKIIGVLDNIEVILNLYINS